MLNFKKIFSLILVVLISVILFISCGKTKITPEESTKIFLDVILKDNKGNMNKIGIKQEDYTKLKKDQEYITMKCFGPSGLENGIVTDEIKNNLKDDIVKGLSKVDYEVTLESADNNSAKVNVKMKTFDMEKIIKDGEDNIKEKYNANTSMTQRDVLQEYFKIIGQSIANGTIKEEPQTVKINLNNKDNVWQVEDDAETNILNTVIEK